MKIENRCFKCQLPSGQLIDIVSEIPKTISTYIQRSLTLPESCGYLLGYKDRNTNNITLTCISTPQSNDFRSRAFCTLRDQTHRDFLLVQRKKYNYYMGTWHTHPQAFPSPSSIDIDEWEKTLKHDITGSEYAFFLIFGTNHFRIWAGDYETRKIFELTECNRIDRLYRIKEDD